MLKIALQRKWPHWCSDEWYYLAVIKIMINNSNTIRIWLTCEAEENQLKDIVLKFYEIITPETFLKSEMFDKNEQKTISSSVH